MSEEGCKERGRNVAMGRGAQLLAALQNSRRQDASSAVSSVQPHAAAGSVENAPPVPRGRAAVLQMLLRERQVRTGDDCPMLSSATQDPACTVPVVPSCFTTLGRGMLARIRMLGLKPDEAVTSSQREEALCPPSGFIEDKMTTPLIQQKPPVVKMGESGTKVPITANYVRMHMDPDKGIFEYEVRFDPPVDNKDMRFQLLKQHQETIGTAKTFDGVTLYLPFRFDSNITIFKSIQPVTNEEVIVKIILRQKRRPSDCIHFYNVLIRRIARILGMVQMKRNYFNPHSPLILSAEKLQLWPGLVTAVTEFEGGLMLCCDVSFRVLRTTTVLDELVEMSKRSNIFQKTATDTLVGLSVLTRYNNKLYRIDDILFDMTPMSTFECHGTPITFVDYYKKYYDIDIKDKGQPLLLNRINKKCQGKEDETQLICLIPELSFLTGLDDRLRSNFTTMRTLANHTRVPPMERQQALEKYINSVNTNEKARTVLSEWGLTMDGNCLGIEGRQMDAEQIILSKSKFFPNGKFDWSFNLVNDVLVPVNVQSWILVFVDRDFQKTHDFSKCLIEVSGKMGIRFASPKLIKLPNDRTDTYINFIREEINPQLQLVVCIFPVMRADRYSAVKTLCSAQFAVPSQCINSKTISRPDKLRSVVQKIALQINCKNGGELWAVNIPTKTMMVCGIDVYHDPGHRGPSVVGFVASTNATMTRWYSRAKFQEKGVELVDTIKVCLIESLKKYYETNHDYPKQIVLFRDGVGDGQLQFCAEHEVPQFLSTFQSVVPPYEPKFTMVVVQKRINARFFRNTSSGPVNPSPGTVIDHTVTRRDWWDFFLVSQHVNQGTVSPTHFIVVHDGGMKPDNLQKLTYKMTMLYYNWCGPVRVPAPCQYAHKLAYLIGENIRKEVKEELCNRLYFL